jgi:two-component system phosphate regulon sensor histidine kinase PhoR
MSMPSDLWWRYLWSQVLGLLVLVVVVLPLLWACNLLPGSTGLAIVMGGLLTAALAISVGGREARRMGSALNEVQIALRQAEKGVFDSPLTSECHTVLPDIASVLERAEASVRMEVAQLSGQRDRLQNVINSMAEGVIGVDREQRILLMNVAACEIFSLRERAALGRPVWEQVRSPQLQTWVAEAVEKSIPAGGEMHVRAPVGRDLALAVSAFHGHELAGAVIVITDVTELRRLERVRQQFVANASHELKTPITSIQACIETLIDGAVDDVQCRDRFLQTINEQTSRLDALVKDLLSLARLESEPLQREPRPVWVEALVRMCYERHLQTAERKGLALTMEPIPADLRVLGEEDALEHILDNLIDNGLKYTEPGGRVNLSIRLEGGWATIDVSDSGIGIPQQHLPRIFERFYRVDRHRSRDVGGTGLGLSIVKHLVQAIGGSISVTSRLNEGSTFSVRLPLAGA